MSCLLDPLTACFSPSTTSFVFAKMAAKRPAASEQSSSKRVRIEDAQSRGVSDAGGSSDEWPTVFAGNEVVWHDSAHNWETDVKEVILNGELFFYEKER